MNEAVIVSAVRTPVGSFGRSLKDISAVQLGVIALKEALGRVNLSPDQVDEVILGNVLQAGLGQNPARQVAIYAGIPKEVPSLTINKVCASGLKSVFLAAQAVLLGDADIVVAGGRGMAQAGWQLVEDLAAALARKYPQRHIAVAGSRGALDSGWIDEDRMVDMTGHVVAPDLYIACGISGTFQHFGAIEKARCVVAVNHNPGAPIFKQADYGLVGDVAELIPALIEALEA